MRRKSLRINSERDLDEPVSQCDHERRERTVVCVVARRNDDAIRKLEGPGKLPAFIPSEQHPLPSSREEVHMIVHDEPPSLRTIVPAPAEHWRDAADEWPMEMDNFG